jgi:hypothetical protein
MYEVNAMEDSMPSYFPDMEENLQFHEIGK